MKDSLHNQEVIRRRLLLEGCVQGMGFRPTVYRLAERRALSGFVANNGGELCVEAEGDSATIDQFFDDVQRETPVQAIISRTTNNIIPCLDDRGFVIEPSTTKDHGTARFPLADLATCKTCVAEIHDPDSRRYRYAFNNCVNCGPRYSIQDSFPYDRANTSMRSFKLCNECLNEFNDPTNRRFHAQATACPRCGPVLSVHDNQVDNEAIKHTDPIEHGIKALKSGAILAIKGIGGFQLIVDASNDEAVAMLRNVKQRPDKPFAIMLPSIDHLLHHVDASELERQLLESPAAPIVLIPRRASGSTKYKLSDKLAPDNQCLGVMLPYSPLHHLLLDSFDTPLVVTSGNLSGEPLIAENYEALRKLNDVAHVFLTHDRPIANPVDDSVVQLVGGRMQTIRLARGLAPIAIPLSPGKHHRQSTATAPTSILALGGHGKSSVAVATEHHIINGPYIGDLDSEPARTRFCASIKNMQQFCNAPPAHVACDQHPDYFTTRLSQEFSAPVDAIQHHLAHAYACIVEHALTGPVTAFAWDGTGFGNDGLIWGGECFHIDKTNAHHRFSLTPFPLPGGEAAVREPRRSAAGILFTLFGDELFTSETDLKENFTSAEQLILHQMLSHSVNTPQTTSIGRLFDAVASILGLVQKSSHEAHGAMLLEFQAYRKPDRKFYPISFLDQENTEPSSSNQTTSNRPTLFDWQPMLLTILRDIESGLTANIISTRFHRTMSQLVVRQAEQLGNKQVVMSGGCFQNRRLAELCIDGLNEAGFTPYWHENIPPNDGGLACGQAAIVHAQTFKESLSCV